MRRSSRIHCGAAIGAALLLATPCVAAKPPGNAAAREASPWYSLGPAPQHLLFSEAAHWGRQRRLLGHGDLRKLDAANVRFNMESQFWSNPETDPFYEHTRDAVRAGYIKLYREMLERQYPLDEMLQEALRRRVSPHAVTEVAAEGGHSSWRLDVAPRLAVGSHGYVGARVSMPDTGVRALDRLSLEVSRGYFDNDTSVGLLYADGPRYVQIEHVSNDRISGERYTASVSLRF